MTRRRYTRIVKLAHGSDVHWEDGTVERLFPDGRRVTHRPAPIVLPACLALPRCPDPQLTKDIFTGTLFCRCGWSLSEAELR